MNENYIFFWGYKGGNKKVLSNFYYSKIKYKNLIFSSSEQLFMYKKAELFKDEEGMKKIKKAKTPKEAKRYGRLVKNFDTKIWDKNKMDIMTEVLTLKFSESQFLKNYLLSTKGYTLVEASPYDRIWGVGFDEFNALENKNRWGQNLLGICLMKVRDEIL